MKAKLFQNDIAVKLSPVHGYGVFANKTINPGDIVEECMLLICDYSTTPIFKNYFFCSKSVAPGKSLFPVGCGVIYNHADQPNAQFEFDIKNKIMIFSATRQIQPGEEIFISYGKDWFANRQAVAIKTSWWQKLLLSLHSATARFILIALNLCAIAKIMTIAVGK